MTYESEREWVLGDLPTEAVLKDFNYDRLISTLLYQRGIEPDEADDFLKPSIEQIPDCTHLYDASSAAKQIVEAAKDKKKIFIHGDFDADGICATSILWDFLYRDMSEILEQKVDALPYIPNRVSEGYGLSENSMNQMQKEGVELLITVDCGVRDKEIINKYQKEHGMDIIVTDHHQPPEDLLEDLDYTIVHPMYPGKEYPHREISGAFVALLLVQALCKELDVEWSFSSLLKYFDLAALSTVADLMPLKGANRSIVFVGLEQMQKGGRKGLDVLIDLAGIENDQISSYHLGFVLGPRVNAAGRIGSALDGVRLFTSNNTMKARQMAAKLDQLNKQRQQITEELMKESLDQIEPDKKIIIIVGEEWPEGIVGLVAGKIMERFRKPTLVITKNGKETKGSARSLGGFNITDALTEVKEYLQKYGGHAEAAGFSVKEGLLDQFINELQDIADRTLEDSFDKGQYYIDMDLKPEEVTIKNIEEIEKLAPFGMENRKPVFLAERCVVLQKRVMGKSEDHMGLTLKFGLNEVKGVLFNCKEDIEKINVDDILDLAGYLDLNKWRGMTNVQFMIKQWRFAG